MYIQYNYIFERNSRNSRKDVRDYFWSMIYPSQSSPSNCPSLVEKIKSFVSCLFFDEVISSFHKTYSYIWSLPISSKMYQRDRTHTIDTTHKSVHRFVNNYSLLPFQRNPAETTPMSLRPLICEADTRDTRPWVQKMTLTIKQFVQ